jgi:hypothetical protein
MVTNVLFTMSKNVLQPKNKVIIMILSLSVIKEIY